jgi:signal transduction histidine kinase
VIGSGELAALFRGEREAIMKGWSARVLADPCITEANKLPEPLLHDHVPKLLEELCAALDLSDAPAGASGESADQAETSRKHARQRFDQGYSTTSVLREISLLRAALIDTCSARGVTMDGDTAARVHFVLDRAMATAAGEIEAAGRRAGELERERLRRVLQLLPVGVFVADASGRLVTANDKAHEIWEGAPLVDATDRYDVYQARWAGTDRAIEASEWALAQALREGKSVGPQELEITGFGGERRVILNSAAPVTDESGAVVGAVAVNVDITHQKEIEAELREEAAFRERFLGILGHDLRTPLSAISVGASLLLEQEDLPAALLHIVRRIATSAARMGRMIADLLDVVRVRRGSGIPLDTRPMNLAEVCREVIEEIEVVHPHRRIELRCQGPTGGAWDRDRLAQVVTNLVTNALEHGDAGEPVQVSLRGTKADVELTVANSGEPIAEDVIPTLFDPFRQGSESPRARRGLGLGLYIAAAIARAHGGSIRAEAAEPRGTAFVVTLPR